MKSLKEHARIIRDAIDAAQAEGYHVNLENDCGGCCSDELTLYINILNDSPMAPGVPFYKDYQIIFTSDD